MTDTPQWPRKGDFISPPEVEECDERTDALPEQEEFWRPPVRFGSVPVEKEPLGWDRRRGFRKIFPRVSLPFQVVERVAFGHSELEPNRLFWGDNLHIMRQLPTESIDLIYIDPPFFSGRQYNVIFGDQNELRSFSDIWEGGMPGYLIWLNARLYEMKRLLKKTGSIYVHCDWHASHYIKVEMDKVFGVQNFRNEVVWCYTSGGASKDRFAKKHDIILGYGKTHETLFNTQYYRRYALIQDEKEVGFDPRIEYHKDEQGRSYRVNIAVDWWSDIGIISPNSRTERIGYPTQKPEDLLERVIKASSPETGVVADFFCGGGTTPAVAQRLGRRWIACDQSRVAVAITADRLTSQVEQQTGKMFPVSDFTIEHWGVYEARRLSDAPPDQFRTFVLRAFGAVPNNTAQHGHKNRSTGDAPVNHGRDGHATPSDGAAARNTGVPPVRENRSTAVSRVNRAELKIRHGARLPHWTMEGSTYAITFRLGDSLPKKVLDVWQSEREDIVKTARTMGRPLSAHEEKRLDYLYSEKVGKYLDAAHGECWMKDDRIARLVAGALKQFHGERYTLLAWCVMPNHVHVVVKPLPGHDLPHILHSWKSFTAHEANKILKRHGRFWGEEYYDHLIRDEADYRRSVQYVLDNPSRAGLKNWKWLSITDMAAVEENGNTNVPAMNPGRDGHATPSDRAAARNTGVPPVENTIHGYKGAIPVWVGEPNPKKAVTGVDVQAFANGIRKTLRYKQDNLRDGIMLAWAFRPDAMEAADRLRRLEDTDFNFIRLDMIRIDSPRFREHVTALSSDHADYENFLTFVQPPKVEVGYKRIGPRTYKFDVSETVVMNSGAKIINVQWDFDYGKRFSSTPGYSFVRGSKKEIVLQAQYEFPNQGKKRIACKVQDDMGGEGLRTTEIEVE